MQTATDEQYDHNGGMKITAILLQAKNKNRVNVSVDGSYRFSLDVFQVGELGIKVGQEYTARELVALEQESQFGKLYARAIDYCLARPHSEKEVRDYLYKKTLPRMIKNRRTGELVQRPGVSGEIVARVRERLLEKGYIDDERFARWWVENRKVRTGTSRRTLMAELRQKGVATALIEEVLGESTRNDESELVKIIAKKQARYPDEKKFIAYLLRQGFSYDDIRNQLDELQADDELLS